MALFPGYHQPSDDDEVQITFPSCSLDEAKPEAAGWLANDSFKSFPIPPAAPPVLEVSSDDSDVEDQMRRRRKDLKRKRREEKRTKEVEKKIPVASVKEKFEFLDPKALRTTTAVTTLLFSDNKRDLENLQFGSVYKKHQAQFRYQTRKCLGAKPWVDQVLFEVANKVARWKGSRYYTRHKLATDTVPMVPRRQQKDVKLPSFVPLIEEEVEEVEVEEVHQQPHPEDYLKDITFDVDVSSLASKKDPMNLADDELLRENRRLNRLTSENPQNVQLWLEFIQFQDRFRGTDLMDSAKEKAPSRGKESNKLTNLGLLERKISILDRAIKLNSRSLALKLLRIQVGRDFWESPKIKEEWKQLEFAHINEPQMWEGYLLFGQSNLSGFTVSKQAALYNRCVKKLLSVRAGLVVTHPPHPLSERFLVRVLLMKCWFLKAAGHSEKAVAQLQAAVEFSLFAPDEMKGMALEQKISFFEPFWDSQAPRIGDFGAVGWKETIARQQLNGFEEQIGAEETDIGPQETELCKTTDVSTGQLWLILENLRSELQWKPWRNSEEPDDPDRIVLFDDVCGCLVDFCNDQHKFDLVCGLLELLGAQLLPQHSSTERAMLMSEQFLWSTQRHRFMTVALETQNWVGNEDFIRRVFELAETKFSEPLRSLLVCHRLHAEMGFLLSNTIMGMKERVTKFKKTAKDLMKAESNRGCQLLFHTYAKCLQRLGRSGEAKVVLQTSLGPQLVDKWLNLPQNSSQLISILACLVTLVDFMLDSTENGSNCRKICGKLIASVICVNRLVTDEVELSRVLDSTVLRARKLLLAKLEFWMESFQAESTKSFDHCLSPCFGCPFASLSFLCGLLTHCTGDTTTAMKVVQKSLDVIMSYRDSLAKHSAGDVLLSLNQRFIGADANLEILVVAKWKLFVFSCQATAILPPVRLVKQTLRECLELFPLNDTFLDEFVQLHMRGELMVQLRRQLDNCSNSPVIGRLPFWWLSVINAECSRLRSLREKLVEMPVDRSFSSGEINRIRHIFEKATGLCPDSSLLWRLWMEFEIVESPNPDAAMKIFYLGVRNCPGAKDFYLDVVRKRPNEVQRLVDMMVEKDLRIRLPLEELEILTRAAREPSATEPEVSDDVTME